MRKIYFLLAILATIFSTASKAQIGYIYNIAGRYMGPSCCGDGGPATAGQLSMQSAIAVDIAGNLYIADRGNSRIRKVDRAGIITTIVGDGTTGYSGDGGLATTAKLKLPQGVVVDKSGNIYIADEGNDAIRKVNALGIISSVVGSAGSGFAGDGGVATAAKVSNVSGVAVDNVGNVYICDKGNNRIRKIDAKGIIRTVAGNGSPGYGGDGGPATAAQLSSPQTVTVDKWGNIFIGDFHNNRVRKVDTAGVITTIVGTGVRGYTGDGGPATAAQISDEGSAFPDNYGNIYIADLYNNAVRVINTAGIITTIAGTGLGGDSGDGGPATAAKLNGPAFVTVSDAGDLYISDQGNNVIRMINKIVPPYSSVDSFSVRPNKLCSGPELNVYTYAYTTGMYVKTDFGDATTDSSVVGVGYITGGFVRVEHAYNAAGHYTINQVLYRSGKSIDTITTSYDYVFCRTFPIKLFYDDNDNGTKDASENFVSLPSLTQVDSNGMTIGKISATSGFNYSTYAPVGTTYSFKVIKSPGNMVATSPATGIIDDTVGIAAAYADKYFGLSCPSKTAFDFSLQSVIGVTAVNDQWGDIYLSNNACFPSGATATLYFSPKWSFQVGSARPPASSVSGNSATWNISVLSNFAAKPFDIYYVLRPKVASVPLTPGDTVHSFYSVTPISGDINPTDNTDDRVDTVRAGYDPNFIEVSPAGCIPTGTTQLQYTIHFENTGNDTAHNIYVTDTLPNEVDPATLRLVMASANMNIGMLKSGSQTIVRFDFPQINLLDSSHHGECDGAVIFNIDLRKGLTDGTCIANHAGIFFDYNDVVMTNTINTRIGCPALSVPGITSGQEVLIYPNPANDRLTIETVSDIYSSCTITNSIGQVLMLQPITTVKTTMNVKQLPAGLYYVTLKGDNGIKVQKFVKL